MRWLRWGLTADVLDVQYAQYHATRAELAIYPKSLEIDVHWC